MLDMIKAFNTVCRSDIIKELQVVLEPDELYIMTILMKDVDPGADLEGGNWGQLQRQQ